MTAKEYLSQARTLDMRIKSKLQQIESLNELATSCTVVYSDMPRNPNRGGSKIERAVLKILIHNLKDKEHPKELLTEDVVELLTTPLDLAGYKTAITEALYKGTKRNVESEKDSKNAQVG